MSILIQRAAMDALVGRDRVNIALARRENTPALKASQRIAILVYVAQFHGRSDSQLAGIRLILANDHPEQGCLARTPLRKNRQAALPPVRQARGPPVRG